MGLSYHQPPDNTPLTHLQVDLSDRNEDEFEAEEPPVEFYLDMSVQENLLENARIGITTLHQCDFDFNANINDENVMVTGFTVEWVSLCLRLNVPYILFQ